jgi:hypothetical protein
MYAPLARSDYYEASAPSHGPQPTTDLPTAAPDARREGDRGWFPRSPENRSASEAPAFTPTASPRLRRRLSPWPSHRIIQPASKLPTRPTRPRRPRAASRPTSVRFEHGPGITGRQTAVPLVHLLASLAGPRPSDSSGLSRTLSGLLPPPTGVPRRGCPQLHRPAATDRRQSPFTPARSTSASWRTDDFQDAKQATCLDGTQVRGYRAWKRHVTLVMAAYALPAVTAALWDSFIGILPSTLAYAGLAGVGQAAI